MSLFRRFTFCWLVILTPLFNEKNKFYSIDHLKGNPIHDSLEENEWRVEVHKRLPNLKKLDGEPIVPDQTF